MKRSAEKPIEVYLNFKWKYSEEWPFNGMVNDLWRGIQANENYLVALGLFAYSEAIGRMILGAIGDNTRGSGVRAYRHFTEKYVGYSFDGKWNDLFNNFRNGLAHEFLLKKKEVEYITTKARKNAG